MKRTLQICNLLALIFTLIINYLSNTGIFNGNTMASVSANYQNLFTPAGYAFSIWGIIYIGLFFFVIYQGRSIFKKTADDEMVMQIGWWFVISCFANSIWILAWLYDFTGFSVLIMFILLFSLIQIVVRTEMELTLIPLKKIAFLWWPFAIYSGWVTVASIANISAYLTKIGWEGFGISDVSWAIIMICIAGVINLLMIWGRNMREFGLVGIWALVAVAVANSDSYPLVEVAAFIVAAIIFINTSVHAFLNRRRLFKLHS